MINFQTQRQYIENWKLKIPPEHSEVRVVVNKFSNRAKGRMVDALTSKGDEGRGVTAISLGEVSSNR